MHRVRAEMHPSFLGGGCESASLQTSTNIRLSAHFVRNNEPMCSLAVWACVVPPSVMQHAVLLGRDSWMRFNSRSYHYLPPRPSDQRVFGKLEIVRHAPTGMSVYAIDPAASGGGFHLPYEGAAGVTLSVDYQLLAVTLARGDGSPALTGHYLVDMRPQSDLPSVESHFVASGRQVLPLVRVAGLEPGDILDVALAPLLSVPLDVLQQENRPPNPLSGLSEVSPVSAVTVSPLTAPASPSRTLLGRLSPEQRASCLRVWARLPLHLRAVAYRPSRHGLDPCGH